MAGNFFATSESIRLEDRHYLRARLQRFDGEWVDAEINLNDHIGNRDGHFAWDSNGKYHTTPRVPFPRNS
jgi:hypothetical protein